MWGTVRRDLTRRIQSARRLIAWWYIGSIRGAGSDLQHEHSSSGRVSLRRYLHARSWRAGGCSTDTALRTPAGLVLVAILVSHRGNGCGSVAKLRVLHRFPHTAGLCEHGTAGHWVEYGPRFVSQLINVGTEIFADPA